MKLNLNNANINFNNIGFADIRSGVFLFALFNG